MEKAGQAFTDDGKVGKQFTEDGKVGAPCLLSPPFMFLCELFLYCLACLGCLCPNCLAKLVLLTSLQLAMNAALGEALDNDWGCCWRLVYLV